MEDLQHLSKPASGPIAEGRKAVPVLSFWSAIFSIAVAFLVVWWPSTETVLVVGLVLVYSGTWLVEATLASHGLIQRFRGDVVLGFGILLSISAALAAYLAFPVRLPAIFLLTFLVLALTGILPVVLLETTLLLPARFALRWAKGLRLSGAVGSGMLEMGAHGHSIEMYGADSLEERLSSEIEATLNRTAPAATMEFIPKKRRPTLGFNVTRTGRMVVLHRISVALPTALVEVLIVPIDGIVARFEDADEPVRDLKFTLREVWRLPDLNEKETATAKQDLSAAYDVLRSPSKLWREKRRQILSAMIGVGILVAFGIIGWLAVVNWILIWRVMTVPENGAAVAFIGGTIFIVWSLLNFASQLLGKLRAKKMRGEKK